MFGADAMAGGNTKFQSFNETKKALGRYIYDDHRVSFYCGCEFSRAKQITEANGYKPIINSSRSRRIEWEHIVPAHAFGKSFEEWRIGHPECVDSKGKPFKGRNCAAKTNEEYRYMECDMYNLVPAVGEINNRRSNYSFAMVPSKNKQFGKCDVKISNRKIEPPDEVKGDVARIYFYMDKAYPNRGIVSSKNKRLFQTWDKQDPVDDWECERCKKIERIQGNSNSFVKNKCIRAKKW